MSQRDVSKCQVLVTIDELDNPVPGRSKIVQVSDLDSKTELDPIVNAELNRFAQFYTSKLSNSGFTNFERAAVKTYLLWKLLPEKA